MIGWLIGLAVGAFVVAALFAPLESLTWWSRRGADTTAELMAAVPETPADQPERYVVYLSGIGVTDGVAGTPADEQATLRAIAAALTGVRVLFGVFPYAADSRSLLQRATAGMWRRLDAVRAAHPLAPLPFLIQARNVLQVLVAADPRYAPTFHAGIAQQVWRLLHDAGYRRGCGIPVTLLGYSGGAQVSLGVAPYLTALGVPTSIVALGGVFGSTQGFATVEHFWDVRGSRDRIRVLGPLAFPGRWPTTWASAWNRARRAGRVSIVDAGPMSHDDVANYFSLDAEVNGRTCAQHTADVVVGLLRGSGEGPSR